MSAYTEELISAVCASSLEDSGVCMSTVYGKDSSSIEFRLCKDLYGNSVGNLHRLNGPAKTTYDPVTTKITYEYYLNGVKITDIDQYIVELKKLREKGELLIPVTGSDNYKTVIRIKRYNDNPTDPVIHFGKMDDPSPFDGNYAVSNITMNNYSIGKISYKYFDFNLFIEKANQAHLDLSKKEKEMVNSDYRINEDESRITLIGDSCFYFPKEIELSTKGECKLKIWYKIDDKYFLNKIDFLHNIHNNYKLGNLDENTRLISSERIFCGPNTEVFIVKLEVKTLDGKWKQKTLRSDEVFNLSKEFDPDIHNEVVKKFYDKAIEITTKVVNDFSIVENDDCIKLIYKNYNRIDGPSTIIFDKKTKDFSYKFYFNNILYSNYNDYLFVIADKYRYYPDFFKDSEVQIESIKGDSISLYIDRDIYSKRKIMKLDGVYHLDSECNYFSEVEKSFYEKCCAIIKKSRDAETKEDVKMNKDSKFMDTLKHDAKEAAYKSTGDTMAKLTSILLTNGLERIDDDNARILAMMMKHPSVVPVIKMLLGVGMVYAPKTSTNEHALKIAEKLRQSSINDGMNAVADSVIEVFDELTDVVEKINEPTKQKVRAPSLNSKPSKNEVSDFEEVPETKHATARR